MCRETTGWRIFWWGWNCLLPQLLLAQLTPSPAAPPPAPPGDSIVIADIHVEGDRRTRSSVVYREMSIRKGMRLSREQFDLELEKSYSTLMNTGLFTRAEISHSDTLYGPGREVVRVDLRETWYIYPVPTFELADRNFNVWWRDQNRSLERVNVGAGLNYYNFTGRRDRLKAGFTTGYTREVDLGYRLPYVNRAGSIGINLNYSYRRQREQNYLTLDNEQQFYNTDDNDFVYRASAASVAVTYRKALFVSHEFELGYRNSFIADTIARELNPNFFGGGRRSQQFFRAVYTFRDDHRDVRKYPWRGSYFRATVRKEGLGITGERSGLVVDGSYSKFIPLGENYSLNFGAGAKYSLIRSRQPFLENRAIGFGDNALVGYQFYVVDGLDMAIWRIGLRRELYQTEIDLGKLAFIPAFRQIPIRVLLSTQWNQGITNAPFAEESNRLNNILLSGAAVGLDVVLYFDMVFGVQYNRNHLGEGGIFLNLNLNF